MTDPASPEPEAETETETAPGGYWHTVKQLLATFADIAYTRVELVFVDLEQSSARLLSLLLWSLVGLFAAALTLLLGALALILVFWDTHRLLVAGLEVAAFAVLALSAALIVAGKLRHRQPLFAATLEELAKDREHLRMQP